MNIPPRVFLPLILFGVAALSACADSDLSANAADAITLPATATEISPLLIGEPAPAFSVLDARGEPYEFAPSALPKPVVLVFYRGGWCPYCSAHMMELRNAEKALLEMGFEVVFASPDRPEKLAEALESGDLDYTLLADSDLLAAQAFGVAFRVDDETVDRYLGFGIDLEESSGRTHHCLPVPSLFIIGTDGVIRFEYINPNYKVRISAPLLLAAAKAALDYKPLAPLRKP